MKKQLRTDKDFDDVLTVLAGELVHATWHWRLFRGLNDAGREYWREFSQAGTFWGLTQQSHVDSTLLHLCKAYDPDTRSINLGTLLASIQAKPHFFSTASFKLRLKHNPYVDSLAERVKPPDAGDLRKDMEFVDPKKNRIVGNLVEWRNQLYAHRDPTKILAGTTLGDEYPLSFDDVDRLLSEGIRIVNHWGILFRAASESTMFVGGDDYVVIPVMC